MRDLTTIKKDIATLPYMQQRELADWLRGRHLASLRTGTTDRRTLCTAQETWAHYRRVLLDCQEADIGDRCRRRDYVVARWCAVAQMKQDGYRVQEISRASTLHHATVTYCLDCVEAALDNPATQPDFVQVWRRFKFKLTH